jgi:hypothetical protein
MAAVMLFQFKPQGGQGRDAASQGGRGRRIRPARNPGRLALGTVSFEFHLDILKKFFIWIVDPFT